METIRAISLTSLSSIALVVRYETLIAASLSARIHWGLARRRNELN